MSDPLFSLTVEETAYRDGDEEVEGYVARADYEHVPPVHGKTVSAAVEGLSTWLPGGSNVQPDEDEE